MMDKAVATDPLKPPDFDFEEDSLKMSLSSIPDVARAHYHDYDKEDLEREERIREKAVEALKDLLKKEEEEAHSQSRSCVPSVTPIGMLWALLSLMVAGTCSFSFLQPFWLTHPAKLNSLGVYSYCIWDHFPAKSRQVCGVYGGYFHFSNLPSHAWQAACVLYGGGCSFLCITAVLAIVSLLMPKYCDKKLAIFCGYLQTMAVLMMVAGLLVYPAGLNSRFVQRYCQGSSTYYSGACQIGWAYMLGIMGTALAMFCPFLSHYTDMKVNETFEYV